MTEKNKLNNLFKKYNFDVVFNFAAQAGVRYSFENPKSYTDSNIIGFINLIEVAKNFSIDKFILHPQVLFMEIKGHFPKQKIRMLIQ